MAASNMSAAAQRIRVIEALRVGPMSTYALRARGISHPAMRVKELIALGHAITSSRVSAVDSDGYTHNGVALYELSEYRQPGLFDHLEAK
ncbi:helix-turn-helix domain-containing protein [Paraburkholderia sp. J67]|uniref:helix-turn-helix domain-containing protein n=1 Tax=Paraburkholderia sp. J67 TaxID=2805435 RepID=UPI002ABD8821|nr:helix-turn-helix domain-containing protein [Paraburkholderia sp. J67]